MVKYFVNGEGGKPQQVTAFTSGCWVDMVNPTDDECEDVINASGVGEDMLKAALDEEESARFESDNGFNMFILDTPIIEEGANGDSYTTLPLGILYTKTCIITVSLKGNTVLKDFITGRERTDLSNPVHFTLLFMLGNATRFLYCLKQIDRKNHRIQAEIGATMRNKEILQLLDLQNSLVYFSTSLSANTRVHARLCKSEAVTRREDLTDLWEDVEIETRQAIETCNIYKNILSVTMDAYGSVISNNSNDTMRRLTVITILLAIPTMIAGFWGMNMPVPFQKGETFGETLWFWLVIMGTFVLTAAVSVFIAKSPLFGRVAPKKGKKRRRQKKDR